VVCSGYFLGLCLASLVWFHLSDGCIAGPPLGEKGLLVADFEVSDARASRRKFDARGHYARPDVFTH
jgi:hypothetical protein